MNDIQIIHLTDVCAAPTVATWRITMTMLDPSRTAELDERLRIPATWLERHAPEQLECECPEACLIDHDS
jgi:hypothetical protein